MHEWLSYDDVAEAYERVHAPRFARVAHDLVAMAKPPSGGRVLDVGTGTAVAAEAAREAVGTGGNAVGIDPSVGMLHAGRTARPAVRLAAASGVDLPFADATFDAVTGNFVISHFPSYETGLADMARVVKPGGRIAVSSWADNGDDLQEAWGALVKDAVPEEMLQDVWAQAGPWHDHFTDRDALEKALIDTGLRHVRSEPVEYHTVYSIDDYLTGVEIWATGRFVRSMLGDDDWEVFRERARRVFVDRFADPLNDYQTALLAVGTKP